MDHTKGKLRHDADEIYREDGTQVCFIERVLPLEDCIEDARRLVACWNACEGFGTQYLEKSVSITEEPMLETLKMLDDTEKECDELLAALRELTFAARTSGGTAGRDDHLVSCCEKAESLLDKYKEEQ